MLNYTPKQVNLLTAKSRAKRANYCPPNITVDGLNELLKNHSGVCDISTCMRPATDLDHCHTTGRVRGLLCSACNHALGRLGDSLESISMVASYFDTGDV